MSRFRNETVATDRHPTGVVRTWRRIAPLAALAIVIAGLVPATTVAAPLPAARPAAAAPAAPTTTITLHVQAARTNTSSYDPVGTVNAGDSIAAYRWLIVKDDVGDTTQPEADCFPDTTPGGANANYPDGCNWPSIHAIRGGTAAVDQIVTQGTEADLSDTVGLTLPAGKFVISVLADGYKIDGAHFSVPLEEPGLVTVAMQPFPLPTGNVRIQVFNDNASTNGEWDADTEPGLAGFEAHISDVLAEVTTDWFGNPLCTQYEDTSPADGHPDLDGDGRPTPIPGTGGHCFSDANGEILIPNLGSNRYAVVVVPPNASWIQTTTLEGSHDWDYWMQEGATGFDTEVVVGGEPVAEVPFGFIQASNNFTNTAITGEIKGRAVGIRLYVPPVGGLTFEGVSGVKTDGPISRPWVALTDLINGDTQVYAARGNVDGTFDILHVPDGDYSLVVWDQQQDYLIQQRQVSVRNGAMTDVGDFFVDHWFSVVKGTVFIDTNANGKQDPGERGLPNQGVVLKSRDNSLQDQGSAAATTDLNGHYSFTEAYPLGAWVVEEVYNDRFYTTGVTYQTDNQPEETTFLGAGVDVSTFDLVGLTTRIDWGVLPYDPGANGGIVGTVVYATTRNELDARLAAAEDYEAGVSGLAVDLYPPVACGTTGAPCDADNLYELEADGSYSRGPLANRYITETWNRPINCTARDLNGNPIAFPWTPTKPDAECVEGFAMSNQVQTDFSAVNGNYGFGDGCIGAAAPFVPETDTTPARDNSDPTPLTPGEWLVTVQIPDDEILGRPKYKVLKEEDINVFTGDVYQPQVPDQPCAGPLHTVHVTDNPADALFDPANPSGTQGVFNPDFVAAGGSPFEGQQKPLCDTRIITLEDQRSVAPLFYVFTDVPVPGRLWGIVTNDLALSTNPRELFFGENAGLPHIPIGLYDFSGRLTHTIETDQNGEFEVILPSVSSYNCPLPAGPCPNVYRFVANDPGTPSHPNANYNSYFRTTATNFQVWPNLSLPADLAPVPVAALVEGPGTAITQPAACLSVSTVPQLYRVSQPYVTNSGSFTITGAGFGATQGSGAVSLDGTNLTASLWSDTSITVNIPTSVPAGPHQLNIRNAAGGRLVNGLTFHVRRGTYMPTVLEVGPGRTFATIQAALQAAAATSANKLVVVYPGTPGAFNPLGAYFENIVIHSPVKLQGVGPGSLTANVPGSIVDGSAFNTVQTLAPAWQALVGGLVWDGNQNIYEGQDIYVLASTATRNGASGPTRAFTSSFTAAIDGFALQGGNQLEFPANLNEVGGGPVPNPAEPFVVPITQGGAIYVNGYAHYLQITNNVIEGNGGTYGAIRLGTPEIGSNNNDHIRIASNRILHNGGTNLAGAIGIFAGSDSYEIAGNDICGNFSSEYGGGISHFGRSDNGRIHDNKIYFNGSYDEGAGIMIGAEPVANPATTLSAGSGPVDIYNNLIQSNLANDDGGGLRFLEAGNFPINVYNNMIVNNVSAHEGGGVAMDDATNVRFFNNTVMKNLTTATAATSNGSPAPAGLSDTQTSTLLQATLPPGHNIFGDPLLFNNIFWDNRAGNWNGSVVGGIGLDGDPNPVNNWDLGTADSSGLLSPTNSVLTTATGINPSGTNSVGVDPNVLLSYDTGIAAFPFGGTFVGTVLVTINAPPTVLGDYHLASATPPANNGGAASKTGVNAPAFDIDNDVRPGGGGFEIGADEFQAPSANLSIAKSDGTTAVIAGQADTYTITVSNAGPSTAPGATVTDSFPAAFTGVTWTCVGAGGGSCGAASGSGNISTTVSLPQGATATFTATGTVSAAATGTLANTATIASPAAVPDPVPGNNTATDSDGILPPLPTLTLRDNFNRTNANTLGSNWSQVVVLANAGVRVNNNQAYCVANGLAALLCLSPGQAIWNGPANVFANRQGAAVTIANTTVNNTTLVLKASGGTAPTPSNFIRVRYTSNQVVVATTTNGTSFTNRATFGATLGSGDTLSAVALNNGTVNVYKTTGSTTTAVGTVQIPTSGAGAWTQGTGGGRIGIQVPIGGRVDNFSGGTVP